jgi:DNA-binding response OmpR family regulator
VDLLKILVVEDDRAMVGMIEKAISKWGHQVRTAETGAAARDVFHEARDIDLVLLDLVLPDVKGYELISFFRQTAPGVPVVAMTGYNTRELEAETRRRGVMYYMLKPFELNQLRSIIDHIDKRGQNAAVN